MRFQESETLEFKEAVTSGIQKEIIAFANSKGGRLYVGIKDDGSVAGLENPDEEALRISNMVRDTIKPDVSMFLHYETIEAEGKSILAVDIQQGTNRPYYLQSKGMKPEGVYVRQGYSAAPASANAIRQMIKETDGDHFETIRCLNQDLSFQEMEKEFSKREIELGRAQMETLKLIDHGGLYSNLALLLSDQCPFTVKTAIFQGTDEFIFRDRREFSGSLFKQMNEVYDFLDFRNQTRSVIQGLYRIDTRDYPETAIREALLNMLVHRDYSFRTSSSVSLYEDRIEFTSIGGLLPGIELEDVLNKVSVCRNENLANVFYRLQLIEIYGTGIQKILRAYAGRETQPEFELTRNTFRIILPNINFHIIRKEDRENIPGLNPRISRAVRIDQPQTENSSPVRSDYSELILEFAKTHDVFSKNDIVTLLGVSKATAARLLSRLVEENRLVRSGKARATRYTKTVF